MTRRTKVRTGRSDFTRPGGRTTPDRRARRSSMREFLEGFEHGMTVGGMEERRRREQLERQLDAIVAAIAAGTVAQLDAEEEQVTEREIGEIGDVFEAWLYMHTQGDGE